MQSALFDQIINSNAHLTSATYSLYLYHFIHRTSYSLSLCVYVWSTYKCIVYLPLIRIYTLQGQELYMSY